MIARSNEQQALASTAVARVAELIYKYSGINFSSNDQQIETRLNRRLKAVGIVQLEDYIDYLNSHPGEIEKFVNAFTTNETCFFRTARVWQYLEETLFRQWATAQDRPIYAWSAASSNGAEAYSLSMACTTYNQRAEQPINLKILASDISTEVLLEAQAARYQGRAITRLQATRPEVLSEYFDESNGAYKLCDSITSKVSFFHHNLFKKTPQQGVFDLVMLRNVLIYFAASDQEKVLKNVYQSMRPGGYLIIGESESLANLNADFIYCEPLIYQKRL